MLDPPPVLPREKALGVKNDVRGRLQRDQREAERYERLQQIAMREPAGVGRPFADLPGLVHEVEREIEHQGRGDEQADRREKVHERLCTGAEPVVDDVHADMAVAA